MAVVASFPSKASFNSRKDYYLTNLGPVIEINFERFIIMLPLLPFFFALLPTTLEHQLASTFLALQEVFFVFLILTEVFLLFPFKPRQLFIQLQVFFFKPQLLQLF
jgi:hypothetical protein